MNKFSLIPALILAFFLTLSGLAISQEDAEGADDTINNEEVADFTGITENEIAEDIAAEQKEKIFETLPAYIRSTPDVQFRKDPLTYLNGKCWEDEIVAAPKSGTRNVKFLN